jgi:hypothetical protein
VSEVADLIERRHFTLVSAHYRDPTNEAYVRPWQEGDPTWAREMHLWRWSGGYHWHSEPDPDKRWSSRVEKFVVLTPFKSKAAGPALQFARLCWGEPYEMYFYPRTYIVDARAIISRRRFVFADG